eukprot:404730-Prymnesium_polylepis.1
MAAHHEAPAAHEREKPVGAGGIRRVAERDTLALVEDCVCGAVETGGVAIAERACDGAHPRVDRRVRERRAELRGACQAKEGQGSQHCTLTRESQRVADGLSVPVFA